MTLTSPPLAHRPPLLRPNRRRPRILRLRPPPLRTPIHPRPLHRPPPLRQLQTPSRHLPRRPRPGPQSLESQHPVLRPLQQHRHPLYSPASHSPASPYPHSPAPLSFAFRLIQLAAIPFDAIRGTPDGIFVLRALKAEPIGRLLGNAVWDNNLLSQVSRRRFGPVPDGLRDSLNAIADPEKLRALIRAAIVSDSIEAFTSSL